MPTPSHSHDVVVLGSGPAGQKAAIQAAKLGARVALIERDDSVGGASANLGTIPSKTLRSAIVDLTGFNRHQVYGNAYRMKSKVTLHDLVWRTTHVIERERTVIAEQLRRNGVELQSGEASF